MCLRFQFCTHQRVCILYFLKKNSNSLYPTAYTCLLVSYRRLSAQFQFSLSAVTLGYLSQWLYSCCEEGRRQPLWGVPTNPHAPCPYRRLTTLGVNGKFMAILVTEVKNNKVPAWESSMCHRVPTPPPSLSAVMAGRKHLNEWNTTSFPLGKASDIAKLY